MRKEERIIRVSRKKRKSRKRIYAGIIIGLILVPSIISITYNRSSAQSVHYDNSNVSTDINSDNVNNSADSNTNLNEISNSSNTTIDDVKETTGEINKKDTENHETTVEWTDKHKDGNDTTVPLDNKITDKKDTEGKDTTVKSDDKDKDREGNETSVESNDTNTESKDTTVEWDKKDTEGKDITVESGEKDSVGKDTGTELDKDKEKGAPTVEEFFKDTIFIGDSRTVDLGKYAKMGKARFYAYQGLSVRTAIQRDYITLDNNQKGNVIDAAKQHSFKRVYLMFGINELGWGSLDIFIDEYRTIIEELRKLQPDASIYIQANYPVTERVSSNDKVFTNEKIQKFNKEIKKMAKEENAYYIDLYKCLGNEKGALPEEASTDGIHLKANYYEQWKQCLLDFGYGFES